MAAEFAGDLPRRHVPQDQRLVCAARTQLAVIIRAVKKRRQMKPSSATPLSTWSQAHYYKSSPIGVQHLVAMAVVRLQQGSPARAPQLQAFIAATRQEVVPVGWKTFSSFITLRGTEAAAASYWTL